ncbi:MAG: hypothetical protein M1820_006004 [Bogoriella megaspora]|nr:MAG: hypothetical protein M1820_006004 [Bogoriella megaspora]
MVDFRDYLNSAPEKVELNSDAMMKLYYGDMFTIVVGEGDTEKTWYLPKELLSHHSEYFKKACNEGFAEEKEKRIHLKQENPATFEFFVQYMYSGAYTWRDSDEMDISGNLMLEEFDAWIMGDFLQANNFKNLAMKHLISYHEETLVRPEALSRVYDNTMQRSLLRKFLIAQMREEIGDGQYRDAGDRWSDAEHINPELLADLFYALQIPMMYFRKPVDSPAIFYDNGEIGVGRSRSWDDLDSRDRSSKSRN